MLDFFFVGPLEAFSEFVRLISFTFRLFGNMTAGEILVLMSAFLVPFVATVGVYGLELLVGLIQGLIFAGLTLVFAAIAMTAHDQGNTRSITRRIQSRNSPPPQPSPSNGREQQEKREGQQVWK